ncbi:MAG: 4Fe-4S dicluster domain-containing protein [Victivallaceae bacterium]|jgi:NAD-dependent dihydropyrimidine dehydrogenase PreA subunit|nr:4Fe-4S dicluster domain-containing protein [Victivallaceae bacterium]MDD3702637.1 4Fe-4S dicluster domain-containing protein [Victivallaceae bacterium]MDD4317444.1 4Fe-4S dicluster domain-containing protein [Victivallaceae bacterium]MDD5663132.1 4Fe-4S dicluster domain-containing protein [Victivallaceae bacterium]NLK82947.1 4Fe-4S dicluster domain-containing protein [Lentisphaerota bacterium]
MTGKIKKTHRVEIIADECKGCGRCINACPKKVLEMGTVFNFMGTTYAVYKGSGCIGCGGCFYACPEPGAISVIEISEDDNEVQQ